MKKMWPCNRQSRNSLRWVLSGLLLFGLSGLSAEPLRIVTWGGAYEAAQRRALFEPYEEQTGRRIEVLQHDGTLRAWKSAPNARVGTSSI